MSELTDKDVPITCPECNVLEEGVDAMMSHILDFHPEYTPVEAANTARRWADAAYDEDDLFQELLTQHHRGK